MKKQPARLFFDYYQLFTPELLKIRDTILVLRSA